MLERFGLRNRPKKHGQPQTIKAANTHILTGQNQKTRYNAPKLSSKLSADRNTIHVKVEVNNLLASHIDKPTRNSLKRPKFLPKHQKVGG